MEVFVLGGAPRCRARDRVLFEKLPEKGSGPLHHYEATVLKTCIRELDDTLDATKVFLIGILIAVGPGLGVVVAGYRLGKGDIDCVKRNDEFVCPPELANGAITPGSL